MHSFTITGSYGMIGCKLPNKRNLGPIPYYIMNMATVTNTQRGTMIFVSVLGVVPIHRHHHSFCRVCPCH